MVSQRKRNQKLRKRGMIIDLHKIYFVATGKVSLNGILPHGGIDVKPAEYYASADVIIDEETQKKLSELFNK